MGTLFNHIYSKDGKIFLKADHECEHVIVKEGVKTIANYAFDDCRAKKVKLPNSVQTIAPNAFLRARQLESIVLQEGITTIGSYAFQYCSKLREITLPHSLQNLGNNAFYCCDKLAVININGNFTWSEDWLSENPFGLLNEIEKITNTNPNFVIEDGALYNSQKTILFRVPVKQLELLLPNALKYIAANACKKCRYIPSIQFPKSIEYIGKGAFCGCESIREIEIPTTITHIPDSCFALCYHLAHLKLHEGIEEMRSDAFMGCSELEFIDYPKGHEVRMNQLLRSAGYEPTKRSPLIYTEYCHAIKLMLQARNIEYLPSIFNEESQLVIQGNKTVFGKEVILSELTKFFISAQDAEKFIYDIVLHRHLGVDQVEVLRDVKRGKLFILLLIKDGYVHTMAIHGSFYGRNENSLFSEQEIDYNEHVEPVANQMPCMHCGVLSENLEWVKVKHDSFFGGTHGHLSICPKCKRQIEFIETLHYSANRDKDLFDLL